MWRQLGTLKSKTDQGVSSIQVPANGDYSNQSCKDCPQWTTLEEPKEIEEALIRRNRKHFGQAQGTPPTISPFKEHIDWAASTHTAEVILEGANPFENDPTVDEIQQLMIQHLRRTTDLNSITSTITKFTISRTGSQRLNP
jgi:hemolysin activation/secretion protein